MSLLRQNGSVDGFSLQLAICVKADDANDDHYAVDSDDDCAIPDDDDGFNRLRASVAVD